MISFNIPLGQSDGESQNARRRSRFESDRAFEYNSERDRINDRRYDQQVALEERRYLLQRNRDDTRLQRLMKDAKDAGISRMAALGAAGGGASGMSPMNITIPSSNPQRANSYSARDKQAVQVSAQIQKAEKYTDYIREKEADAANIRNDLLQLEYMDKSLDYQMKHTNWLEQQGIRVPKQPKPLNKYIPVMHNIEEATKWYANHGETGIIPWINPELGAELPESFTGFMFMEPRSPTPSNMELWQNNKED